MHIHARRLWSWLIASGASAVALGGAAVAQDRLPPIAVEAMTPAQQAAATELETIRGIRLRGPWIPLLRSPDLITRVRALGDYLRFDSALPPHLSEFLILLTARQWTQQYEWSVHRDIAVTAGVSPAIAAAIAEGRRPDALADEQAALYALFKELTTTQVVSDATYARAVEQFGEQGVIDAVAIVGYYTLLAMVLNTAQTPVTDPAAPLLPPLPR
jgi:4-carboxymuconolactone decarboxylase